MWEVTYCRQVVPEYEVMDAVARERIKRKHRGEDADPMAAAQRNEALRLKQRKRNVRECTRRECTRIEIACHFCVVPQLILLLLPLPLPLLPPSGLLLPLLLHTTSTSATTTADATATATDTTIGTMEGRCAERADHMINCQQNVPT